ncbi:MAG: hypothetical protein Q9222_006743 [Ikaeria aurantiellina]
MSTRPTLRSHTALTRQRSPSPTVGLAMSRPRRAASSANKSSISVARSSPSPDEAKKSIHLTVKMPSNRLREATGASRKMASLGEREGLQGGEILRGPRGSRAKRAVVVESDSDEDDEDGEEDEDGEGEEEEEDDVGEGDEDPDEEDEADDDPDDEAEADDQDADADADGDVDMEDAEAQPPPPVLKITGPTSKPTISVTPAQADKVKSVEAKEMELADDDDEELSDLGSEGEEDAEGDDDDLDQEDGGRSMGDGSRASTPDLSKMTKRQRSRLDQVMGGDFLQLPMEPQIKKHLTAEEHAMRRAEMARRRKNLSEKRNEEEKLDTINRLLKKQAPKRRGKISAEEITANALAAPDPLEVEVEKANPVYVRWPSGWRQGRRTFMAGWKSRGYVLDSDEEVDTSTNKSESQDRCEPAEHDSLEDCSVKNVHGVGTSVSALNAGDVLSGSDLSVLQDFEEIDELQAGHYQTLPTVHPEPADKKPQSTHFSSPSARLPRLATLSSPLSSSSLTLTSPFAEADSAISSPIPSDSVPQGRNEHGSHTESDKTSEERGLDVLEENTILRVRNLRRRNPIQLHPYAIEGENYRQILKRRGVKPLRIAQAESQSAHASFADSQTAEFLGRSDSQESVSPVRSSPSPSQTSNPQNPSISPSRNALDIYGIGVGDLPDVEAILRSMPANAKHHRHKRRKIAHSVADSTIENSGLRVPQLASYRNRGSVTLGSVPSLFDVPPSPPHSQTPRSSSPSRPNSKGFRFPRGITPAALPTPVASSEPGRPFVTASDESSQPDNERSSEASSESGAEMPASESARIARRHIGGVQRKIRGVLPASWLKLDLKAQARQLRQKKPQEEDMSPRPIAAQERGVARPIIRYGRSDRQPNATTQIVDSSSESDPDHNLDRRNLPQHRADPSGISSEDASSLSDRDLPLPGSLWGEAMEDNHVDTMIPTNPRNRMSRASNQAPKSRKKQIRLTDMHVENSVSKGRTMSDSGGNGLNHSCLKPKKIKSKIPKFRPPALGLLDVSSLDESCNGSLPTFARVARRTLRSRNDRGRSLPNRKILKLANESETQDANQYLRSWREGALRPRSIQTLPSDLNDNSSRSPLQPCTSDRQNQIWNRIGGAIQSRSSNTNDVRPQRRVPKPSQSRKGQSSLDHLFRQKEQDQRHQASHPPKHVQLKKVRGRTWRGPARSGHLLSSLEDVGHSRPAGLELLRSNIEHNDLRSNLPPHIDRISQLETDEAVPNPLLAKFLHGTALDLHDADDSEAVPRTSDTVLKPSAPSRHGRQRKRRPKRLVSYQEVRTDTVGVSSDENDAQFNLYSDLGAIEATALVGLGSFGTSYTTTFGATPLPVGTYFTESTFAGSGEFAKVFNASDLDHARGFYVFQHHQENFRWGPWDECVSSQAGSLIDQSCQNLQQTSRQDTEALVTALERLIDLLRNTVLYFSSNLSFHDPVDRLSFLQRWKHLVNPIFRDLISISWGLSFEGAVLGGRNARNIFIRAIGLCMVLVHQLRQLSKHEVVPNAVQTELGSIAHAVTEKALDIAFTESSVGFLPCVQNLMESGAQPFVIHEDYAAVETLVMASHLQKEGSSLSAFWQTLRTCLVPLTEGSRKDVQALERRWETLFQVLPFLEIDQHGILEVGRRRRVSTDNWATVKSLVEPVLEVLQSKVQRRSPNINTYCRALFGRCHTLINDWEWCSCEPIIGAFFDFFAAGNLAHLPNEESHGSVTFLAQLDQQPRLELAPEDRCFHVFLKIVGSGIKRMQKVYTDKKIRSLVWRYIPNHGRFLPKDQEIHQSDLDALRNHHDLLCTLYWASPPGFRPRLKIIQDLVDVQNSHKEACRINIRAWSNLVTFQLGAHEPPTLIEPFVSWCMDIVAQLLRQHQQARTEAEEQVRQAESSAGFIVSRSLLESTITQNQRQIEANLTDLLLAMRNAIAKASNLEVAGMLLFPNLTTIFALFSAKSAQTNKVVIDTLDVLLAFTAKLLPSHRSNVSSDEESQDYGDFPIIGADMLNDQPSSAPAEYLGEHFYMPLRQLMSNCFGADSPPEDAMLAKVIDAWVAMGRVMVIEGLRAWTDFIGGYENDSWTSLRDTEQTRKFSAYYLAAIVDADSKVLIDHRQNLMKSWAASLVERASLLKYQHQLTSSLLNADPDDPLLANPPFWATAGRFQIAPSEFAERRLSLISNLLSNMRQSIQHMEHGRVMEATKLKADHKEILKAIMSSMKRNYSELGQGPDVQGAYVDFVHRVIELLQQHTSNICSVDPFFTDSSSFPLPVTDPTYVVGQLKSYGLRLHDLRTPKQLAVFVQSVSERAAVDRQQGYLVNQLCAAMEDETGRKGFGVSELCSFLLLAIFPVYIDVALNTACGWIMALPILDASTSVFSSIMTSIDGAHAASVRSTSEMLLHFLDKLRQSLQPTIQQQDLMNQPKNLKIMTTYLKIVTVVIPTLDYICRLNKAILTPADNLLQYFKAFALFGAQSLLGHSDSSTPELSNTRRGPESMTKYADVQAFASQELNETLRRNWTCHGEQYYILKGHARREVVVDLDLYEEEKEGFVKSVEGLFNMLNRMTVFRGV